MHELILLRHAHAEPVLTGRSDYDRPLSPIGLSEAEAAGRWIVEHRLIPDRVVYSPARRTRETLEALVGVIGSVEQRLEESIYEATAGTLIALADAHRDVDRLLLLGHNPGLERVAALLHSGSTSEYRGMPPASIAVLQFADDGPVEPGVATLSAFWWP